VPPEEEEVGGGEGAGGGLPAPPFCCRPRGRDHGTGIGTAPEPATDCRRGCHARTEAPRLAERRAAPPQIRQTGTANHPPCSTARDSHRGAGCAALWREEQESVPPRALRPTAPLVLPAPHPGPSPGDAHAIGHFLFRPD